MSQLLRHAFRVASTTNLVKSSANATANGIKYKPIHNHKNVINKTEKF